MPRYNLGLSDADAGAIEMTQFIPGILGSVFGFFFQLASIQFLGISILEVLSAFLAVAVVLMILKVFGGSK